MNDTDRLTDTVSQFCRFMETLPVPASGGQDWGPKEVLAHLVYHHELYVNLVEAFVARTPLAPPTGRFRDLNAAAVAASRGESVSRLVGRLQKANRRLVELCHLHSPEAIVVEIKAGAKPRTLEQLVPEVEAHIRNHLRQLRRDLRERQGEG